MPSFDDNNDQYVAQNRGTIKALKTTRSPNAVNTNAGVARTPPTQPAATAVMHGLPAELGAAVEQELSGGNNATRMPERMPVEHGLAGNSMVGQTQSPSPHHVALAVEDLPSKGAFYHDVSHIHVRRLQLAEIRQIGRSRTLKSSRLLVAAIGRTIDFPVMNLTEGDYHYILHWQRLNSFKKMRTNIEFNCMDPAHLKLVAEDKVAIDTLRNTDGHPRHVSLTPKFLDVEALEPLLAEFHETYGIYPYVERMEDIIEAGELDDDVQEQFGMYLDYAPYLSPDIVAPLIEADPALAAKRLLLRAKYLQENEANFDADFIHMLDVIKEAMAHGVDHKVSVSCAYCAANELGGASAERSLQLDAGSFLP